MPFAVRAHIEGLGEVLASLRSVKSAVGKKLLKKAINDATRKVLQAAKAGVQRKSGLLRKSLGRKVKVYRNSGTVVGLVGPRVGFRTEVTRDGRSKPVLSNPTKYAHLVEKGTSHSRAYPFLGPAWTASKEAIREAIISTIRNGIEQAAKSK